MIYTLNILAELAIRSLSGGDIPSDSPYSRVAVILEIKNALREDMKLQILEKRAGEQDDRSLPTQYIASYPDVVVQRDVALQRDYINLPSAYTSLKYNKGVYWISPMKRPHKQMVPVTEPTISMNLRHGQYERQNYGYYVEGQKAFFTRDILRDEKIDKVLLKLVVAAPDTWGNDDPLPVIPENIGRVLDIVKKRIQNVFLNDRIADGNPNIRQQNV